MNTFISEYTFGVNKGRPMAKISCATMKGVDKSNYLGIVPVEGYDEVDPESKRFNLSANSVKMCMLTPTPDPNMKKRDQREVYYVSGPSGAGKSTICGEYMRNYHDTFPKDNIVVFSAVPTDKAFDGLPLIRVKLDDVFRDNQIERNEDAIVIEDLKNCLVLFDDIDRLVDTTTKKIVQALRDECLDIGRHWSISMMCTSHQLMNYKETRGLLNEANKVIVFPNSAAKSQIKNYFKIYGGLDKHQIASIFKLRTQWVCYGNSTPQYIMHMTGAYML